MDDDTDVALGSPLLARVAFIYLALDHKNTDNTTHKNTGLEQSCVIPGKHAVDLQPLINGAPLYLSDCEQERERQ